MALGVGWFRDRCRCTCCVWHVRHASAQPLHCRTRSERSRMRHGSTRIISDDLCDRTVLRYDWWRCRLGRVRNRLAFGFMTSPSSLFTKAQNHRVHPSTRAGVFEVENRLPPLAYVYRSRRQPTPENHAAIGAVELCPTEFIRPPFPGIRS